MRANKKVDIYIYHCMAAGAKLTKRKSYVSGEREAPSTCLRVETAMAPNAHDELADVL